jgi:hypothetical protein
METNLTEEISVFDSFIPAAATNQPSPTLLPYPQLSPPDPFCPSRKRDLSTQGHF